MRPDYRAIDGEQAPVNGAVVHLASLEPTQDTVPKASTAPIAKAIVHRLPWPKPFGHVTPASAIGKDPENGIDHEPVVFPLAASLSIGRQQILDLLPLFVGELVGRRHCGHLALLGN
jgi:hypothetical protein